MREVTTEEFDEVAERAVRPAACPVCWTGMEIVVKLPMYGLQGVFCRCPLCGLRTRTQMIHEKIADDKRIGSLITEQSILRGARKALEAWNRGELIADTAEGGQNAAAGKAGR